jgi:MFS family permease
MNNRPTQLLLNLGHAIDHMFLLIFATAVTSIAAEFGMARWEDLMPYGVAAFFFFGLGSLPAGKLGDHWGRRPMMVVFFFGMGAAALLVSFASSPIQIALALALLGCFASIYHPIGIPMLVQGAARPGWIIGVNGLAGNLGLALAAVVTGFLVKYAGWRAAFAIPGIVSLACGIAFALVAARESTPPARKKASGAPVAGASLAKLLFVMTLAATSGSLNFNFSTNANYELLMDRFQAISQDPARIGLLLAFVYAAASLTQLVVGSLLDKVSLKRLYLSIIALQGAFLALAMGVDGWGFYALQFLFMAAIFGAIPFTDAMIVRFVDDTMRSRVAGMRLTVSLGASSLAVWLIGPVVKQAGFTALLGVMVATSVITLAVVSTLPRTPPPKPRG